jgi:hypothetical protein
VAEPPNQVFRVNIRLAASGQFVAGTLVHQLVFPDRGTIVNLVVTMKGSSFPQPGVFLVELLLDDQRVADTTVELKREAIRMGAMKQPTANHQSETFGSGQTQFFECEALSVDHPEIQARERVRQQRLQLSDPTEKQGRPTPDGDAEKST